MKAPNICKLFNIRMNVEAGVSLIETPLTYVGTNDNVVIHVKELPNNRYLIDDGGNADWFASTAGYDFKSTSTDFFIKSHESLLGVKINENGEVYTISDGEDAVSLSILRVAQCSASLHSTVVFRQQKSESTFKKDLRDAILSVMDQDEVVERYEVPNSHNVIVDYKLQRNNSNPVYIIAASEKARLLEAELLGVQLQSQKSSAKIIAVVESQNKVSQTEFERASYFVDKALVFNKTQMPDMLKTIN